MFILPFLLSAVLSLSTPKDNKKPAAVAASSPLDKGHWLSDSCTSDTTHECHRRINPNTCANVGPNGVFECQKIKVCSADLDQGVYQFTFGKTGSFAYQSFEVESAVSVWVSFWDCFCPGDAFQLYVDDIPVHPELLAKAQEGCSKPLQPFCRAPLFSDSPLKCFVTHEFGDSLDPGYFAGDYYVLTPGKHKVALQVVQSPFNAGSGFITFKAAGCGSDEEPCCAQVGCNFWTVLQPNTQCPRGGCGRP